MGLKIDRLQDLGFLSSCKEGRKIVIDLTPQGESVARMLCSMEKKVYGDVGDPGHVYEGSIFPCSDDEDEVSDWYMTSRELAALSSQR